jgi:hypothetical protein
MGVGAPIVPEYIFCFSPLTYSFRRVRVVGDADVDGAIGDDESRVTGLLV